MTVSLYTRHFLILKHVYMRSEEYVIKNTGWGAAISI